MKEQLMTAVKKIAVMFSAAVMILGIVPVGLMVSPTTVRAEGEFLRILPQEEMYLGADRTEKENSVLKNNDGTWLAGGTYDAYMRFDIRNLLDKKVEEVHGATLRLVLLRTPAKQVAPLRISLVQEGDWEKSLIPVGEVPVGEILVSPKEDGAPLVAEVDLTTYLKQWIESGRETVSLHIDGITDGVTAVCAGKNHEDPAFRPCLKVVTGNAQDPDSQDITKVWQKNLIATGQAGKANAGEVVVGNGSHVYLQFGMHPENIKGAIYQAGLQLELLRADADAELKIYQFKEMNADNISQRRKTGLPVDAELIYSGKALELGEIDLAYAFQKAWQEDKTEVNLLLQGSGGMVFAENLDLKVRVSDDEDIRTVMEAVTHTLGENPSAKEITRNLPKEYKAENGKTANIRWKALDNLTGLSAREVVAANGKVRQPRWFEESRSVSATATVTAGDYSRSRSYDMTILPAEMPAHGDSSFGSMVAIGDTESEKKQQFESSGTAMRDRFVAGKNLPYRSLPEKGVMALQLAVSPEEQNYLTLKIWAGDSFDGVQIRSLQNRELNAVSITRPELTAAAEDGFLYLTYPLPMTYTRDRSYVSLQMTALQPEALTENQEIPEIYGAYITQTPYFDPATFVDEGEVLVKKLSFADTALYQFFQRIKTRFNQNLTVAERTVVEDEEENMILIKSEDSRLILSLSGQERETDIYQETPYYSAYSRTVVADYAEGKVQAIDYGVYRIFRNQSEESQSLPWQEEGLSGLYRELTEGGYYSFIRDGEMADTSVLPEGTIIENGESFQVAPGETVVLMLVAEPLACPDWRVSEINGQSVSGITLTEEMDLTSVTIRNLGASSEKEQNFVLLCGVYERGMLTGMQKTTVTVLPGQMQETIALPEALRVLPGQALKIFLNHQGTNLQAVTPVLEIP